MATTRNRVVEVTNGPIEKAKRKPLGNIPIQSTIIQNSIVSKESDNSIIKDSIIKKACQSEKENEGSDTTVEEKATIVEEKTTILEDKTTTVEEKTSSIEDVEDKTTTVEDNTTTVEDNTTTVEDKTSSIEDVDEKNTTVEEISIDPQSEDKENVDLNADISEDLSDMSIYTIEPHEDDWCFSKMLILSVPEYEEEIQKYLLRLQLRSRADPSYLVKHKNELNGKMRTILIDWMVEVVEEYKMTSETLFLAVNFVDRFLSILGVARSKFQLLGTTALFISSKYEEIYPPDVHEFVYITDNAYDKFDILGMETKVLKALDFNISTPTIHYFLRKHLCTLGLKLGFPQTVGIMAEYYCYLSLMECDPCVAYLPNDIAISAIILAADSFGIDLILSGETGQAFFPGYSEEQLKAHLVELQSCVDTLHYLRKAIKDENDTLFKSGKPQQAIFNKYAQEKYFSVSLIDIGEQESPKLKIENSP